MHEETERWTDREVAATHVWSMWILPASWTSVTAKSIVEIHCDKIHR